MSSSVTTSDGVRLTVDRREPAAPSGASVVVAHGFTGSGNHDDVRRVIDALADDGFLVFSYDSRGHGRSEGICTLGDLERHDVAAVTDLARAEAEQVVLVGASMGAIAVLRYASDVDDLSGVVAVSSPALWRMPWSVHGLFSTVLTRTRPGRWLLRRNSGVRVAPRWTDPEPPLHLVERIAAPVAFVHGRRDPFIKPEAAVALHRARPDLRRLDLVADMGHAFDPTGVPAIRAAVAWTLRPVVGSHA